MCPALQASQPFPSQITPICINQLIWTTSHKSCGGFSGTLRQTDAIFLSSALLFSSVSSSAFSSKSAAYLFAYAIIASHVTAIALNSSRLSIASKSFIKSRLAIVSSISFFAFFKPILNILSSSPIEPGTRCSKVSVISPAS